MAQRVLNRTLAALRRALESGQPVVVLEPSCAAVFRSDAAELIGSGLARLLAGHTKTLAEMLNEAGWRPSRAAGHGQRTRAIAQVHCHQHAILGFDNDRDLLRACGVDVDVLDTGCCGLAGNFGFERGHYDVSVGCAERGCGRPSPPPTRAPRSSPMASPAGPRSRPTASAAVVCIWPASPA